MSRVGVIGDKDSVLGFRALGMDVAAVSDAAAARAALTRMMAEEYAVVFVTEPLAQHVSDLIQETVEQPLPAVILIPSATEKTTLGLEQLRQSVRRATGMDILRRQIEEGMKQHEATR